MSFKIGDILIGDKDKFDEAYHPIVFIDGPDFAPDAVILTHSGNFPCNLPLSEKYIEDKENCFFVAHLIKKVASWGPYKKVDELIEKDLAVIKAKVKNFSPITWDQYLKHTVNGCPDHIKLAVK